MMNTLAQSGSRAEVFTAETQDRAEARLQRMRHSSSPVQLVRNPDARSRTIIITQLNRDRQAVNAGIHAALSARGELGQEAVTVTGATPDNITVLEGGETAEEIQLAIRKAEQTSR
ncbi:hypothetical protein ACI09M_004273 [Cronobacter dublinensis]